MDKFAENIPIIHQMFRAMRYIIIILLSTTLISCSRDRLTIYEYNQTAITRIDNDGETYFYYGDLRDSNSFPKEYIIAKYSGLNYVMACYLLFNNDKTVTLIDIGDGIEKVGDSRLLNIYEHRDNQEYIQWSKIIRLKYGSVIKIEDALKNERETNKLNNSKVMATYLSTD